MGERIVFGAKEGVVFYRVFKNTNEEILSGNCAGSFLFSDGTHVQLALRHIKSIREDLIEELGDSVLGLVDGHRLEINAIKD